MAPSLPPPPPRPTQWRPESPPDAVPRRHRVRGFIVAASVAVVVVGASGYGFTERGAIAREFDRVRAHWAPASKPPSHAQGIPPTTVVTEPQSSTGSVNTTTTTDRPVTTTTQHSDRPKRHKHPPSTTTTSTSTPSTTSTTTTGIGLPNSVVDTISCPVSVNLSVTASGNGTIELAVTGAGGSYSSNGYLGSPVTIELSGPAGLYYFTASASEGSAGISWQSAGTQQCRDESS